MAPSPQIASPREHHKKPRNLKQSRLTPNQCREVTDDWESRLGKDKTRALVGKYTDPTCLSSTKGAPHHVKANLAHHLDQESAVSSAHSKTGGRRNPGRNDGLTWNGDSFICADRIHTDWDYSGLDPLAELCPICEEEYEREVEANPPRMIEISLADIPAKARPLLTKTFHLSLESPPSRH